MGKASSSSSTAAASSTPKPLTEMKRKKKKGRPSLTDLQNRQLLNINNNNNKKTPSSPLIYNSTPSRRSSRRNPNLPSNSPSSSPFNDADDDDDDEREQKKVKLVVRLPQSNNLNQQKQQIQLNSQHSDSGSGSGSDSEDSDGDLDLGGDEHHVVSPKKDKTNAVDCRSDDVVSVKEEKVSTAMDSLQGVEMESGPTTTLPDKKLLFFILDRLQKKDTYGVFSEPVDPNELPDYHEIIKHPMDFGTVRKKLDGGRYSQLEELEADLLLICSNAMQYNAPDTVYHRQARSIQELVKRDFANLRNEGDDGEPQPKIVRRGRPPSKNLKKSLERSPVDRTGPELSSGATLATEEDKAVGSNSYSLRKTPSLYKFRSSDALVTPHRLRNGENGSDWSIDWNNEFPASILRADMKYGKKNFIVDEHKRDTYKEYHPSGFDNELPTLSNIDGDMKRLMAVGLHFERHAYARSLATFAANLGPVAWKIASQKIETVLPAGVKFGPGWVGENEAPSELTSASVEKQKPPPSNLASNNHPSRPVTPSEEMVEAVRRLNSQNESAVQGTTSPWGMLGSSFQGQHNSASHPNRNGFNGMLGYSLSQLGMTRPTVPSPLSGFEQGLPSSLNEPASKEPKFFENRAMSHSANFLVQGKAPESEVSHYPEIPAQHRKPLPIPPDLNAPGSPSSSLHIGSPQQPDLALQL